MKVTVEIRIRQNDGHEALLTRTLEWPAIPRPGDYVYLLPQYDRGVLMRGQVAEVTWTHAGSAVLGLRGLAEEPPQFTVASLMSGGWESR